MLNEILNIILFRKFRTNSAKNNFMKCLQSELAEDFLDVLLKLMSLIFCVDKHFRRNIENFNARYLFMNKDGSITVAAVFNNGKLKVSEQKIDNTDVTVIFKDERALMNFILSPKPDILHAMLNQEVTFEGNLNYLSKFAFMATHLQLMVTKQ
ncbi:MAG: hypothetical protein N3B21_00990 [Clostridia bacterium]|nr:hypothetical protein [Clostridia bacterium]